MFIQTSTKFYLEPLQKEKIRIVLKGEGVEWIRDPKDDMEKMIIELLMF